MKNSGRIAILGGGNLGTALARGLVRSGKYKPSQITITRKQAHLLDDYKKEGYNILSDNIAAIKDSDVVVVAVRPQQICELLKGISKKLDTSRHILISVVSGVSIDELGKLAGSEVTVIRAMPNTSIAIQESMTCLASKNAPPEAIETAKYIFDSVGLTMLIEEEQMTSATALCACGIAFFLRAIRAAAQGGIQTGFHSDEAMTMAAQTARGAASLLLSFKSHPEAEIDRVTTPKGCTIAGLNEMEHQGFSSAMIKGIVTATEKAGKLYNCNLD